MKSNTFYYSDIFFLLLFLFLYSSCYLEKIQNPLLLQADSLIEHCPDSALLLLQDIPYPQKMNRAEQALYALLKTKAEDKNYITHTNDSLIRVAVNYYKRSSDRDKKAEAYYYWGSVYRDMGQRAQAISRYQEALLIKGKTENRLSVLIYNNLAALYKEDSFYEEALNMTNKAYSIALKENRNYDRIHLARDKASIFMHLDQLDSALYYYKEVLYFAEKHSDEYWKPIVQTDIAHVYYIRENFEKAHNTLLDALNALQQNEMNFYTYSLMGRVLSKLNQVDSARCYFQKCLEDDDIYICASSYFHLYEIECEENNLMKAIEYNNKYLSLRDSISIRKTKNATSRLINKHTLEMYNKEFMLQKQKEKNFIIIIAIIVSFIIVCTFLLIDRRRRIKIVALQEELVRDRITVWDIEESIEEAPQKENKENKKHELNRLYKKQITDCVYLLKSSSCYRKIENIVFSDNYRSMCAEERESLCVQIKRIFLPVMETLKAQCPELTKDEIFYCIIFQLVNTNKQASILISTSENALKMKKSRIKAKIDTELFSIIFKR